MKEQRGEEAGHVERGASEEASGTPPTPTEKKASRRPPSSPEASEEDRHGARNPEDFSPDDFE
ncbi:hypothetical protein [Actinocorallia aurantiaca]|uniref:Uncharacterized protein n=1 Tax=Actinocorallia aurantiaca TaxID=46204 RepID=A0ABP6GSJ8_9ACTN